MSKVELLDLLWPVVQAANSRVESFSQISPEMIEILEVGAEYPSTDKGTMIRAAFYKRFEGLIDSIYLRFEAPAAGKADGGLSLDRDELKTYLANIFGEKLGFAEINDSTDFFEAGVDSLQAITARGIMMRELDLGTTNLGQNVVFEYPNISILAEHLYSLRTGEKMGQKDEIELMGELIQKYSTFSRHIPGEDKGDGEVVVSLCCLKMPLSASNLYLRFSLAPQDHLERMF